MMRLTDLGKREGIILKINTDLELKERLMDLGMIEGTKVRITRTAPLGDPIEINLRGFMISLRKEDADKIIVYEYSEIKTKR